MFRTPLHVRGNACFDATIFVLFLIYLSALQVYLPGTSSLSLVILSLQCIVLVDFYAPLLLSEISSMKPTDLCQKTDLCKKKKNMSVSQHVSKDKCDLCHSVITEALEKLKDPDTEIVKLLMEACGSTGKNIKECKSLVIQYTPNILVHAQKFLETKDLCTILHACNSTPVTYTFK
ncbi:uncharacterized protein [Primulina huaijiensis]|uniref:uncharacterized protein isoform X2 n=1 Tax=Primulina huaijiensis TaxID=1492673 RepID=UPI003CC74B36